MSPSNRDALMTLENLNAIADFEKTGYQHDLLRDAARYVGMHDALVDALTAVMDGCRYGSVVLNGETTPPDWNTIRMPTPEVMNKVRVALAKAKEQSA